MTLGLKFEKCFVTIGNNKIVPEYQSNDFVFVKVNALLIFVL